MSRATACRSIAPSSLTGPDRSPDVAGCDHADRNDRTGPDGRQHGQAADGRRPRMRGARRRRGADRRARVRRRDAVRARSRRSIAALERPRHVWIMVPAAFVGSTVDRLAPLMSPDDTIIDGGNSWYRDDVDRAERLRAGFGINYLDVGTSGGIHGLERGYCLMVGGDTDAVGRMGSIFDTLAPGVDAAERTPGRSGDPTAAEQGWLHCGPSGAGHFVKMVHNGIEYGLMAAFAEGFNVLAKAGIGRDDHPVRRRDGAARRRQVLPLRPRPGVDRRGVAARQRRVELAARPHRRGIGRRPQARRVLRQRERLRRGSLDDPRRGRRGRARARAVGRPVRTIQLARRADIADKILSAMRAGFGGHHERKDVLTMSTLSMQPPAQGRRAGAVRRDRRSRQAQAVPGALRPRDDTASSTSR